MAQWMEAIEESREKVYESAIDRARTVIDEPEGDGCSHGAPRMVHP